MNETEPIVQPKLGVIGGLRYIWRQLTSMRTALGLLLLLAVAAVPGSIIPQRRVDPNRVDAYLEQHPSLGPWLERLGGFDVYASPWFSAVYLLLFVSLIGCVVPRLRAHFTALRAQPVRTPSRLNRMPHFTQVRTQASEQEVLAAATAALKSHRYRRAEYPGSIAGERGYAAETGNLLFHFSLLGLLVAAAVQAMFAYTGQAVVVAGDSFANTLPRYDSFQAGTRVDPAQLQPFSIKLDELDVRFEKAQGSQFGAPRDFTATVTVRDRPGATPRTQTIKVNQPLDAGGARVFLVGNGYAADVVVRDGSGQVAFSGPVPLRVIDGMYTSIGAIKVPDANPAQLGFPAQLLPTVVDRPGMPTSVFPDALNPRLLVSGFTGDLGMDSGRPQSVYVLDTEKMKQLREGTESWREMLAPGQTTQLPGGVGSLTFKGVVRYAAFDLRHDPSNGYALWSAVSALLGLMLSLYARRRRVWVAVAPHPDGGTQVQIAGLAKREDIGLERDIASILKAVVPAATDQDTSAAARPTGDRDKNAGDPADQAPTEHEEDVLHG